MTLSPHQQAADAGAGGAAEAQNVGGRGEPLEVECVGGGAQRLAAQLLNATVDLGIYDFETFPYITRPDPKAIQSGERTLRLLDAIDEMRHLTPVGEIMVRYPLLPRHSRALVEALKRYPHMIRPVGTR